MAFMALFGWIFIPIILLYLIVQAVTAPLRWAAANPGFVNAAAAGLLAVNLLVLVLLLRGRARRKRAGKPKGLVSLLAALWEGWVVFLCALFLLVQPLRFIPEDFGQPFSLENKCYGTWTVVSCQGAAPGCTQSQEEIDASLGQQIAYSEDRFVSTSWAYPLGGPDDYRRDVVRRESFPSLYGMKLEALGADKKNLDHIAVTLPEGMEEDLPLGQDFYILDKNTLLIYRRGVFFRAERAEEVPAPDRPDRPIPPKVRDLGAPSYFATWMVTDFLGLAPEPMDQEQIEKTMGAKLTYKENAVWFEQTTRGGSAKAPDYTEEIMSPDAFMEAYGVALEVLGVEADTYLHVTVEFQISNHSYFDELGGRFLLLDEETMLLCCKGAFFRAELIPDTWPMIPDPDFEF